MKQRTIFFSVLLSVANFLWAQTDMTHRIVNPSFEQNLDGWTNDGMQAQNNNSFTIKVGNVYAEKWTGKGGKVGNASLKQTVAGLPNGNYTLSIVAQNIQQDSPTTKQTGVYVQANSNKTQVNVAGEYSVSTTLTNGTLNIAFVLSNATGNYVCVDDFRLILNSCTTEQLAALLADAQALASQKMSDKAKAALDAAIAAAQAHSGEQGITDVAAKLSDAFVAAKACAESFANLDAAIAEGLKLASQKMSATAKSDLDTALETALSKTTADDITSATNKLAKSIAAAKTSIESYAALKKALDDANKYYTTSPTFGADALKEVIDAQQTAYDGGLLDDAQCASAVIALSSAVIACRVENGTGAVPKLTSEHFMPVGSTAALGRMTATGSNILERGYVWATHPNPTLADNRSTVRYENNGDIYELSPLEPATEYYVRAYALTKTYAVAYGEEQRIFTLPKATCRWSYDEAGDAATNDRIRNAVKESCDLYNKWTSIPGFHLNAHYVPGAGAGDGTADCSYGGWMRVSQNVSYQRTGTLLHESNHGVGVGTSARWKNWDGSNLRTDGERGDWLGWRATQMVRFFDHNNTSTLHGDGTHMWPYGINGAHEDDNRKILYIANVLITHAVHQDGLAAVDGIGASPAYTFAYEDGKSYFLTNEDATCGAGTGYLYETSAGLLKWGEASAADLTDDSEYAWQFEYVPEKAYYRIRNAKSGKYLTFSGTTIKTAAKSKPAASELFQIMIGYPEISVGNDQSTTHHGYWIQAGTGEFAPAVLTATTGKATKGETLNFSTRSAFKQRWLILTAAEARIAIEGMVDAKKVKLSSLVEGAKALAKTPHHDLEADASETFKALVSKTDDAIATIASEDEADRAINELTLGITTFLAATTPDEIAQPYELTFMLEDTDFENDDHSAWTCDEATPTFAEGICEIYQSTFDIYQTLPKMPKGIYAVSLDGFERPGGYQQVATDFAAGTDNSTAAVYLRQTIYKAPLKNIMEGASETKLGVGREVKAGDGYIPDDMAAANAYLKDGRFHTDYVNKVGLKTDIKIGVKNKTAYNSDWVVMDNFRVFYYGNEVTVDDVTAISDINVDSNPSVNDSTIFDISGRVINAPTRGIYIEGGKKVLK